MICLTYILIVPATQQALRHYLCLQQQGTINQHKINLIFNEVNYDPQTPQKAYITLDYQGFYSFSASELFTDPVTISWTHEYTTQDGQILSSAAPYCIVLRAIHLMLCTGIHQTHTVPQLENVLLSHLVLNTQRRSILLVIKPSSMC